MKGIIIFLFAFISTANSQSTTWTIARCRDSIIAIQKKQAIKDQRDDERNVKIDSLLQRTTLLSLQNDRSKQILGFQINALNDSLDYLKKVVDKMSFNLSGDFFVDTVGNTLYLSGKEDTLLVKRLNYNSTLNKMAAASNSLINKAYVDDLKFQITQLGKSVDVRDKIIDRLQLTLKKERAKNKLKK